MTPEAWQRVREVLERAIELDSADRAAYLDEACGGDRELRQEVESLMASFERAGDTFLEGRAIDVAGVDVEPPAAVAGQRIGAYQVVEEIGHGGMGVVYRAVRADDQFRKEVAIKVVRGGLSDDSSARSASGRNGRFWRIWIIPRSPGCSTAARWMAGRT